MKYKTFVGVLAALLLAMSPIVFAQSQKGQQQFKNPPQRSSKDGVLQATLRVACKEGMIGGRSGAMRNYIDDTLKDARWVGPVYRLKAGDLLKIHLINELPSESTEPCGPSKPIENITNLHTHGFHVSPAGNSDNVLLTIEPGQDFHYEIKIPEEHHPGTHWYHAHKHGSTAIQVSNGMSGALIIEGEIDEWKPIAQLKEKIFILQQFSFETEPKKTTPTTAINGQLQPIIHMQPGQIERWRFIHAGVAATIDLQVRGPMPDSSFIPLHEFAKDGIATGKLQEHKESITLQPGYRTDVLFQPKKRGRYELWDDDTPANSSLLGEKEPPELIAIIEVEGKKVDVKLPRSGEFAKFRAYEPVADGELVEDVQLVWFEMYEENRTWKWTVNGKSFDDPDAETRSLILGQAQKWEIWVGKKQTSKANHPFHIHVNPFEVIVRDSRGIITDRYWKDTILIKPFTNTEEHPLEIRSRYEKYVGEFVLHCHNLAHEDAGMMQLVKIVTPGAKTGMH